MPRQIQLASRRCRGMVVWVAVKKKRSILQPDTWLCTSAAPPKGSAVAVGAPGSPEEPATPEEGSPAPSGSLPREAREPSEAHSPRCRSHENHEFSEADLKDFWERLRGGELVPPNKEVTVTAEVLVQKREAVTTPPPRRVKLTPAKDRGSGERSGSPLAETPHSPCSGPRRSPSPSSDSSSVCSDRTLDKGLGPTKQGVRLLDWETLAREWPGALCPTCLRVLPLPSVVSSDGPPRAFRPQEHYSPLPLAFWPKSVGGGGLTVGADGRIRSEPWDRKRKFNPVDEWSAKSGVEVACVRLPFGVELDDVRQAFEKLFAALPEFQERYARNTNMPSMAVVQVTWMGRSQRGCFVEFKDEVLATTAVQMNGIEIGGRRVSVERPRSYSIPVGGEELPLDVKPLRELGLLPKISRNIWHRAGERQECILIVSNTPPQMSPTELRQFFEVIGSNVPEYSLLDGPGVRSLRASNDRHGVLWWGVEFQSEKVAQSAKAVLANSVLGGFSLVVKKPKTWNPKKVPFVPAPPPAAANMSEIEGEQACKDLFVDGAI